jgi:hypothetical protein
VKLHLCPKDKRADESLRVSSGCRGGGGLGLPLKWGTGQARCLRPQTEGKTRCEGIQEGKWLVHCEATGVC